MKTRPKKKAIQKDDHYTKECFNKGFNQAIDLYREYEDDLMKELVEAFESYPGKDSAIINASRIMLERYRQEGQE